MDEQEVKIDKNLYLDNLKHIHDKIDRYFLSLFVVFTFYVFYGFLEPIMQKENQNKFREMDESLRNSRDIFLELSNLYRDLSRPSNANVYQYLKTQIISVKNDDIREILDNSDIIKLNSEETEFILNYERTISSFIELMENDDGIPIINEEKFWRQSNDSSFEDELTKNRKYEKLLNLVELARIVQEFKGSSLSKLDFQISNKVEQFNSANYKRAHINIGDNSITRSFPLFSALSPYFAINIDTTLLLSYRSVNSVSLTGYNIIYIKDLDEQIKSLNKSFEKANDYYDSKSIGIPFSDWTLNKLLIIFICPVLIIIIMHYLIFFYHKRTIITTTKSLFSKKEYRMLMKTASYHFLSYYDFHSFNENKLLNLTTRLKKFILGGLSKIIFLIPLLTLFIFLYNISTPQFWKTTIIGIYFFVYLYIIIVCFLLVIITIETFPLSSKLNKLIKNNI